MNIFGLVGEKLGHSLSPQIHEQVFDHFSIDARYNLFSINKEDIKNVILAFKTLGVNGTNVTIPYKETIMNQLDVISDEAKKIGAVNTVHIKDGLAYGYNTDYYGFKKMLLRENVKIFENEFYVLGSGGAAKAVVHLLVDEGAKVFVVSRDKISAERKFNIAEVEFLDYDDLKNIKNSYAIVNTTPCGMYPSITSSPVDKNILKNFKIACDIVYNPEMTRFLNDASGEGLKIVKGLFMLVAQAMKAEEIWNEKSIPKELEETIFMKISENFR